MEIEIFDSGLEKEDVIDVPHRTACRGIVKKGDRYLVTRLSKHDIYMFPGGGVEENENYKETCKREVLEETGINVEVLEETVRITEYFIDSKWTNVYFACKFIDDLQKPSLTDEEKELGLETVWLTQDELLDILENNMTKHSHGPNIHNREFLALINSL